MGGQAWAGDNMPAKSGQPSTVGPGLSAGEADDGRLVLTPAARAVNEDGPEAGLPPGLIEGLRGASARGSVNGLRAGSSSLAGRALTAGLRPSFAGVAVGGSSGGSNWGSDCVVELGGDWAAHGPGK
jgi:hypothetical protein